MFFAGERPYPCLPCGFSFKTKSNLYKHRKSLAHTLKVGQQQRQGQVSLSSVEDGAHSMERDPEAKEDFPEDVSEGESEKTESDMEASVEEEEMTVIREETLPVVGDKVLQAIPVMKAAPAPPVPLLRDPGPAPVGSAAHSAGGAAPSGAGGVKISATSSSGGVTAVSQLSSQALVHDKPVREGSILENIRLKIDKRKLMEWSRQMDRIKHQEHVEQLQIHSKFPVRIAPKSSSAEEPVAIIQQPVAQPSSSSADEAESRPEEKQPEAPRTSDAYPVALHPNLSVHTSDHDDSQLLRQASAPAALSSPPAPIPQLKVDGEAVKLDDDSEASQHDRQMGQATQALRNLEALSEKFPNTPGCTYTFKTLPDNALQVIIHMAKDSDKEPKKKAGGEKGGLLAKAASVSTASSQPLAVRAGEASPTPGSYPARLAPRMPPLLSRSISADTKMLSKELLKERIQQLISANEAIVDMPMADPPRSKGRFSRQNSDSGFQAWKFTDPVTKGSELSSSSSTVTSASASRIAIPNITSIPLQPMPAESESLLRSSVLSSSASLDVGRERSHKDLRRSISASGVRMVDQATYLSLQQEVEKSSLGKRDSPQLSDKLRVASSLAGGSVSGGGGGDVTVAEVSLVSEDGNLCIPASLPVEVINAISSSATMTGNASGEIKIQFKLAKSKAEESQIAAGTSGGEKVAAPTTMTFTATPMIGQPSVQFPQQATKADSAKQEQKAQQDNSVIKNLLKRGAAVYSPSSYLAPPSTLDFPTTRPPKLKSDARVKSADSVYGAPHIVKSSMGAQQVILTVKDIHAKSMDMTHQAKSMDMTHQAKSMDMTRHAKSMDATHQSKSMDIPHHSDSLDQTKVQFVRDAILGIPGSSQGGPSTSSASQDPAHPKASGEESLRAETAEQGHPEHKQHHCPDCGVSFNQVQILNMHKMYYCNKVKPMSLDEVVEVAKAKQAAPTSSASSGGSGKLQFHHHQTQQQLTVPRRSSNPAFLKSHSTTEVEARAAWQKEDYPQLRSQLTLRPSQSVDEGTSREEGGAGAAKPQQNFIIENIDPLVPPKKGRPKGSKNKPKDLNMILAKANAKASAVKAFAGLGMSSVGSPAVQKGQSPSFQKVQSPVVQKVQSPGVMPSVSASTPQTQSPLAAGVKLAPKLILPRSQYITPLLISQTSVTAASPPVISLTGSSGAGATMIGQPMISIQPADSHLSSLITPGSCSTPSVIITPSSSAVPVSAHTPPPPSPRCCPRPRASPWASPAWSPLPRAPRCSPRALRAPRAPQARPPRTRSPCGS